MAEHAPGGSGLRAALSTLDGPPRFLLLSSFLIPLGSFMILPFMSVFLHERLGMGLGTVGIVLAVASLVQFSGGIVGGALADRIGLRRTMLWALIIRTAGFIGLLLALRWPPLAVAALVLTCCGAALYLPANKAYLVHGVDDERRPAFLSAGNAALNAGMAVGPLIAGPFVLSSPGWLFVAVTALFVLVTVGHARLPPAGGARKSGGQGAAQSLLAGVAVLPFAANALAFYLYFHFQHYLAVYAVERASSTFYSLVLLLCFTLVIVVQPLASGLIRRMPYATALTVGFTGLAAGLAVLAIGTRTALLAGGALITLGDIVLFLKNDLEALHRSPRSDAVVFGQQRLAAGLGACASGVLGGQLYSLTEQAGNTGWFWLMAAAQCLVLPPVLLALRKRPAQHPHPHHDDEGALRPHGTNGRVPGR
ncbi:MULTISPECIES: MDR family MFS transporter [Streptomyces]|uniref:Integral membrane protein n=1 Tax=Streptomyces coelicolor (strain ATCC BAA-471 / A3(2) / M145) TaxID=100226 RepID=Q9EX44_STRCO|nr:MULTISPECIES: MFS transporter [Streptomyces]MYU40519.1 MFS transporter [Streptomyces sp. SID7813]MDX2923349.1 MFS transporter [Streptomyces sp. NRRL_B-16638]MDX3408782.1 MFS transporter [Streptomyces sp. ME02-6977A]QFI41232.1 MFS transporter [Streptomyces coelicolor A3(2)]TYP11666.1 putative MFS family arabinose efflux permease [Streptomyces coelicolor]